MSEVTVNLTINEQPVQAQAGELVIAAAERVGVYIPHFCYHPRMSPVGMCRMCIVDIDTGRGPALQPSCMVPVSENMVVDTNSPQTQKAQDGVLEFLLLNHPLDCPVCDKGGECPLQDQTMAYGPGESRFIEEKRHHEKPIAVNDLVYLDRERCILCDRCTRFADEVAGDPLITFQDRGDHTQVNTFPHLPFSSYFSGNTVQICPVGALTAKQYRFKARPWDLSEVESTYPNPMGDRVVVQASRDQVLRYQGADSDAVNWGWLSDKDRFSLDAHASEMRLQTPLVRGTSLGTPDLDGSELVETSWQRALSQAADAISAAVDAYGPSSVALLGGARLSNEDQYVWARLAKAVIGTDNADAQLDDGLPAEAVLGWPRATINGACTPGGTVILLAPDPKEQQGTLYLRLRHAVMHEGVQLIELTPRASGLSQLATHRLYHRPAEVAAVAKALVGGEIDLDSDRRIGGVGAEELAAAANSLAERADRPITVILGRPSLAEPAAPTLAAAAELAQFGKLLSAGGRPGLAFLPVLHRANVFGALDMGLAPGFLPGRVVLTNPSDALSDIWGALPSERGLDAHGILSAATSGEIKVLILLGADPLGDFPNLALAQKAVETASTVIACETLPNASTVKAHIVFPAASFAERDGTHTNLEGRITRQRQIVTPPGTARPDWVIATELARKLGCDFGYGSSQDIWAEICRVARSHEHLEPQDLALKDRLAADLGVQDGVVVAQSAVSVEGSAECAVQSEFVAVPQIDSYSLRLVSSRQMYDRGTLVQHASLLAGLARRALLLLHTSDFQQVGVAQGTTVQVISNTGQLNLPVVPDSGVPKGTAVLNYNHPDADVRVLLDPHAVVTDIRIQTQ
ncbi:MAG: molybdopterin-dependent oxidoreductase [Acidimicrobiia bacterium]|nr:molybdopterin-dependent oxidoreductase [Acidimicrobiia bacterium]MYC57702.1 molybdopterin-dependent oxidoreductase [Acidimicrobiia bacterium]MYI30901.1 molybdopterin-dependent oxidoreductase [Acidimicrobiia bacterium]